MITITFFDYLLQYYSPFAEQYHMYKNKCTWFTQSVGQIHQTIRSCINHSIQELHSTTFAFAHFLLVILRDSLSESVSKPFINKTSTSWLHDSMNSTRSFPFLMYKPSLNTRHNRPLLVPYFIVTQITNLSRTRVAPHLLKHNL